MIVNKRFIEGIVENVDTSPPSFMKVKLGTEKFHLFSKGISSKTIYFRQNTPVMFLDVVCRTDSTGGAYYNINILYEDSIVSINYTPIDTPTELGIASFLKDWKQL